MRKEINQIIAMVGILLGFVMICCGNFHSGIGLEVLEGFLLLYFSL